MGTIAPIGPARRAQVSRETRRYIEMAGAAFGRSFDPIGVLFDLGGRAAGMYRVHGGRRVIRYNPFLFAKYFEDNLAVTVPHEVAHYVTDMRYGIRNVRPHGAEWREAMALFGADPAVTCNYDLDGIPVRVQRRFSYRCRCTRHQLTTRRHNRVSRGEMRYFCRRCGAELVAAV